MPADARRGRDREDDTQQDLQAAQDHVFRRQGPAPRPGQERAGAGLALEQKSILALVKAATIEILDGGPAHVAGADTTSAGPHEVTRGHRPAMTGPTKGQRGN